MAEGKVICSHCNYGFVPKTGKAPQRCPYCDRTGTLQKSKQMQDWIDEAEGED